MTKHPDSPNTRYPNSADDLHKLPPVTNFEGALVDMINDSNEWLAENFSAEDVDRLRNIAVDVAVERSIDLADLLCGWAGHVEKIERDMPLPSSDRSVWGAHDLIAAYAIREFLQSGLGELDGDFRARVELVVSASDEKLRSFTEPDLNSCIEKMTGRVDANRGWWWRKIPIGGPVREEAMEFCGLRPG